MPVRIKKLIGSIIIVTLALCYAVIATTVASARLADASGLVHLLYFLVTGLFWVVPAIFLISWMTRTGKAEQQRAMTEQDR